MRLYFMGMCLPIVIYQVSYYVPVIFTYLHTFLKSHIHAVGTGIRYLLSYKKQWNQFSARYQYRVSKIHGLLEVSGERKKAPTNLKTS